MPSLAVWAGLAPAASRVAILADLALASMT